MALEPSDAATIALVTYLRSEADQAEQKAKSLRAQADQLAAAYSITEDMQQRYALHPSEVPPLDEHGVPKYPGKKRGRKRRPRQRQANPHRKKRQHTAYTLFVQEQYPIIKQEYPDWASKDVISLVAKMWAAIPPEEKGGWKLRAMATHDDCDEDENGNVDEEEEDDEDVEEGDDEGDEGGGADAENEKHEEEKGPDDDTDIGGGSEHTDPRAPDDSDYEEQDPKVNAKLPTQATRRRPLR